MVYQSDLTTLSLGTGSTGDDPHGVLVIFSVLALLSFLPGAIFYLTPVPSYSIGLFVVGLLLLALTALGVLRVPMNFPIIGFFALIAVVFVALAAHLIVAAFFVNVGFGRPLQSLALAAVVLASAPPIVGALIEHEDSIDRVAGWLRIVFVIIAILGITRIQPPQFGVAISGEKSVFPYAEPSHFALAFTPYLVHACVRSRGWRRYGWLLTSFLLAYMLQSLSLVVGTVLVAAICLPISRQVILGATGLAILPFLDIGYFLSRLDFGLSSQAISALVYRQGWELAYDAISRTMGWGIGFQQLGWVQFFSPSADILYRIIGNDSNTQDGGFLAAKLLSELGLFGFGVLIYYLLAVAKVARHLRRNSLDLGNRSTAVEIFVGSMICGSIPEMLVRGLGYFSSSMLLCVTGFVVLTIIKSNENAKVKMVSNLQTERIAT